VKHVDSTRAEHAETETADLINPAAIKGSFATQKPSAIHRRSRLRLLVADAKRLAKLLGVSVRSIRTWDSGGKLPRPVKVGSRKVWVLGGRFGIRAWLAAGAPPRTDWETQRQMEDR
jgi:hypothetical protein